jgi:hypothetical protein
MRNASLALLVGAFPALASACVPPQQPARAAPPPSGAPISVNISLWPGRHTLAPLLRADSAPLVVYEGSTLAALPGCALAGRSTKAPRPSTPLSGRLLATEAALDAQFPLRDPSIHIVDGAGDGESLPIVWRWLVTEERRLRSLEDNTRPASSECARATHAVIGATFGGTVVRRREKVVPPELPSDELGDPLGLEALRERCNPSGSQLTPPEPEWGEDAGCSGPIALLLAPLGAASALPTATHLSVSPEGESWSMSVDGGPECRLPCDRWLMPGATARLRRGNERPSLKYNADPAGGDRAVRIAYEKDGAYPAAGVGMAVGGTAAAAVGFGLLATGNAGGKSRPPGSSGPPGGSSGGEGSSLGNVAGLTLLGVVGTVVALGGATYLVSGPTLKPVLRTVEPAAAPSRAVAALRRTRSISVTPSGLGIRF